MSCSPRRLAEGFEACHPAGTMTAGEKNLRPLPEAFHIRFSRFRDLAHFHTRGSAYQSSSGSRPAPGGAAMPGRDTSKPSRSRKKPSVFKAFFALPLTGYVLSEGITLLALLRLLLLLTAVYLKNFHGFIKIYHPYYYCYDGDSEREDIYIVHDKGFKFPCGECGELSPTARYCYDAVTQCALFPCKPGK